MKHKKWVIMFLVSLVLIASAVVFTFVFLIPKIERGKLLDAVLTGDEAKTKENFRELTNEDKEDLREDIQDIVVYTHNRYIDGKISYDDLFATYSTVESIRNYRGMTEKSMENLQPAKLIDSYEKAVGLYDPDGSRSGDAYKQERDNFRNLMRCKNKDGDSLRSNWESDLKDAYDKKVTDALDAYLKEKYEAYRNGSMDYDKADAYARTADSFWGSDYSGKIRAQIYYDKWYQERLDEAEEYAAKKEYFSALNRIDSVRRNNENVAEYAAWKSRFNEKYKEYEEAAKSYYTEQAIEYIKEGDTYQADYLVRQLKEHFGEDFDTSAIDAARPAEWIDPFLKVMKNWKSNLKNDYQRYRNNAGIYNEYDFDEYLPDQILLMDLDADGTPEMILQNSEQDAFIYSYHDGNTWFMGGVIDYKGIREPGEFLFAMTLKDEDGYSMTYRILECVRDHQLVVDRCICHMVKGEEHRYYEGTNITVSGDFDDIAEIDEATYNQKKDEFDALKKADSMPVGVAIDGYEEYIRNWK